MILADTSVWIEHLRAGSRELSRLLDQGRIVIHPFVVAELALGSLQQRAKTLALLDLLPRVDVAQLKEVRAMIEARHLYSLGIGLTDVHLIASVFLAPSPTLLWTKDRQLRKASKALGIHCALD